MAGEDKRIRVTADISQLDQMRQSAISLMRDLVNINKEFSNITSGNINSIQKEIDLLEQRNRLISQPQTNNFQPNTQSIPNTSSPNQNTPIIPNSNSIEQLLKDILDVIRDFGKNDPNSTDEDTKYSSTGRQVRGGMVGPVVAGIAASIGSSSNIYELAAQFGAMAIGAMGSGLGKALSGIGTAFAKSGNPIAMGVGAISSGVGGFLEGVSEPVAAAVGALAGKSIGLAEQHERSSIGISQVLGGGIGSGMNRSWSNSGIYSRLGMTVQEGAQEEAKILAGGRGDIMNSGTLLDYSKNYSSLDVGTINRLQSVSSYSDGSNSVSILQEINGTLKRNGLTEAEIRTQIGEYVNLYSQTSEKLLERSGSVNGYDLVDMMNSLKSSTGMDVKQLSRVFDSIVGANGDNNDQIKYMRMQVAREMMPNGENATPFEVMGWIQQNLSNKEFQKAFFDYAQRVTGGPGTPGYQAFLNNLGIEWGDMFNFSSDKGIQNLSVDEIFENRSRSERLKSENLSGVVTSSSIAFSNTMTGWGEKLVPILGKVLKDFADMVKTIWNIDIGGQNLSDIKVTLNDMLMLQKEREERGKNGSSSPYDNMPLYYQARQRADSEKFQKMYNESRGW